ncbi:uncharacterized protein LOC110007322 isoform X4 [Amborella trichopoda]|uniref:uncharacterized protein LOC110007322 isoform X4 n=1 Tax=Amborella trichopoda TaxID=13333 RepID=UPI0009C038BC|nr:uncharacterized protein LOC110007322 isoform X4 [Amborella trichopoda]|eukprot:XP_020523275.1 uncharacterized protein LOC110007322 isoform X4 [Amborella trichopoda]
MVNLFVKKIRWVRCAELKWCCLFEANGLLNQVVAKKQAKKTRTRFDPLLVDPLAIVQVEPEEQPLEALPPVEEMEARSCSYRVQVLMQHNGVITKRSLSLFSR